MMFLDKCFPEFFIILRDEIERRGKTQIMAVVCKQLHAEAVNRAKESAIKGGLNRGRTMLFENALPCSLLHLVGRAMGKRDHDKLRQDHRGHFSDLASWTMRSVIAWVLPEPAEATTEKLRSSSSANRRRAEWSRGSFTKT